MGKRLAGGPCRLVTRGDQTIPPGFRWSNRSRLLLLALGWAAASPALARGPERVLACPAQLLGQPLRNGQVMAGAPQDIAILQGDNLPGRGHDTRVIWHVEYLYRGGGQVSLECEYAKVGKAYLSIPTRVKTCQYTEHRDRVRLACT